GAVEDGDFDFARLDLRRRLLGAGAAGAFFVAAADQEVGAADDDHHQDEEERDQRQGVLADLAEAGETAAQPFAAAFLRALLAPAPPFLAARDRLVFGGPRLLQRPQ